VKLSEFDFNLPQKLIAQTPVQKRDQCRLMVVHRQSATIQHDSFSNIAHYLNDHPLVVFNDTQVVPAKLTAFIEDTGKYIEILLVKEIQPDVWQCLLKGLKKMKLGTNLIISSNSERDKDQNRLTGSLIGRDEDKALIRFTYSGNFQEILHEIAQMPLPPYIHRDPEENADLIEKDRDWYQTVYAANPGAVAAPTAGLHFTKDLIDKMRSQGVDIGFLTLHVGLGTFKPIRVEAVEQHQMDPEEYRISADTWNKIYQAKSTGRKVFAVGTTATRVLESVVFDRTENQPVSGTTDHYIYPGYSFRLVDGLITNFHLPKSTLYLLVCAFAGKDLMARAYKEGIEMNYRFFSYGDAMLIL
jgi:S-adenosylmethionine:tRNA ribosyltransferase-isomerase